GQTIARLDQTELRHDITEDRRQLSELLLQDAAKTASEDQRVRLQQQQNQLELKFYEAQRTNLSRSLEGAEAVEVLLRNRVKTAEALRKEGLMAEGGAEFADVHVAFRNHETRMSEYKSQLEQLDGKAHSLETQLSALVQQNLEASTTRRNQIAALKSRIAN